MPQSLAKNLLHLVYSTRSRRPWLLKEVRSELFAYQAGIFHEWDCPALVIGGVENHALKKIVEEVKKGSSKWMKHYGPKNAEFCWQAGYAAFSVSESNAENVRRYIENREDHHREKTFEEELRLLLQKHRMEFDERYVWD